MDKWLDFYRPYFVDEESLERFICACEELHPEDEAHRAKIMMHQGQRLVSLSENAENLDQDRAPLKLLFLVIAAEAIAKLHDNFDGEGRSKHYVRQFFEKFTDDTEKEELLHGIEACRIETNLQKVVDILYAVRCDVVHEGKYWWFDFATEEYKSILTGDETQVVRVMMTFEQLKLIVVNAIIRATKDVIKL